MLELLGAQLLENGQLIFVELCDAVLYLCKQGLSERHGADLWMAEVVYDDCRELWNIHRTEVLKTNGVGHLCQLSQLAKELEVAGDVLTALQMSRGLNDQKDIEVDKTE